MFEPRAVAQGPRVRRLSIALLLAACGEDAPPPPIAADPPGPQAYVAEPEIFDDARALDPVIAPTPAPMAPPTFIGDACAGDADCGYEGAVCVTQGFPGGTCSMPCDRLCPDRDGHPLSFCAASASAELGDACVSRCDYARFPSSGCREGYGCRSEERANEPGTRREVCLPGEAPAPMGCLARLAALGVDFEPTTIADRSPSGHPELVCHVEEPVIIHPPIHGVDLRYYDGSATPNVRGACAMIEALVKTVDDLAARGVTTIYHYGTYNCRVISGTNTLSRHAYGDAIDLHSFGFADGRRWTVNDHFEAEVEPPLTVAGTFLYDAVHRWHDALLWTIILTPNYNAAHRDHFHVDLTPGSSFLGLVGGEWRGYLGPAPYDD